MYLASLFRYVFYVGLGLLQLFILFGPFRAKPGMKLYQWLVFIAVDLVLLLSGLADRRRRKMLQAELERIRAERSEMLKHWLQR